MTENAVLYALSTLAQTCAALAALVGAVGLYRLQSLRANQETAERNLRGLAGQSHIVSRDVAALLPVGEIAKAVAGHDPRPGGFIGAAHEALGGWRAFPPIIQQSRNGLILFEAWNLLLIGVSLVGFNYVPLLMSWPGTFWSLWAAALGTVGVTGYCVYAWTRG